MKRITPYILLLALVLWLVATPDGVALDHWLVERAVALEGESPALHATMKLGTRLGRKGPILAGLLVPAVFGGEVARATVRLATVAAGGNWMATHALKWSTNRTRPNGAHDRRRSSFPSGHASATAALALVVSRRHRRLGPWIWALAAWVTVSRVFLGLHYPSDALAGVLLGALCGTLALRLESILGSRLGALRIGSPTPQPVAP